MAGGAVTGGGGGDGVIACLRVVTGVHGFNASSEGVRASRTLTWGVEALDTSTSALLLEFTECMVASEMHENIAHHTTAVVSEDTVSRVFIVFTAFGGVCFVIATDAIQVSVEGIDFRNEEFEVRFGD